MDPFHHHHHRHRDEDEDENRQHNYPPPDNQPPPFLHVSHDRPPESYGYDRPTEPYGYDRPPPQSYGSDRPTEAYGYDRPPPQSYGSDRPTEPYGFDRPPPESYGYDRPPPQSYGYDRPPPESYGYDRPQGSYGSGEEERHGYQPHHDVAPPAYNSGVQHVGHVEEEEAERRRPQGQSYRIFTKADEGFSLSIRNGQVVLVRNDPDDEFQLWIKDLKYSTKVKDAEGFPAFALVNKVTGEAIKHSLGQNHPVQLVKYNPDYLDESVLWSESKEVGDGFRCIRMVNNIHLNFDAFNGDKDHGGVKDGTTVVLWEWWKGDNQKWKIVPR